MDRRRNPFAPGAGIQPPELAGRDRLIEDATIDMERVLAGRPTKGYLYFIQEWGFQVWNVAPSSPVTSKAVEAATPAVISHPDDNFFRVRFDRLTPLQQKYLRAMAELGPGPHQSGEIAATLGVETPAVATVRQNLITKGMVWSRRHGETAFTVPMFDNFMKRKMPALERHVPRRRTRAPNCRSALA